MLEVQGRPKGALDALLSILAIGDVAHQEFGVGGLEGLVGVLEAISLRVVKVVDAQRAPDLYSISMAGFDDEFSGAGTGTEQRIDGIAFAAPGRIGAVADTPDVGIDVAAEGGRRASVDEALLVGQSMGAGGELLVRVVVVDEAPPAVGGVGSSCGPAHRISPLKWSSMLRWIYYVSLLLCREWAGEVINTKPSACVSPTRPLTGGAIALFADGLVCPLPSVAAVTCN